MNTPLAIAVVISRIVVEAQAARLALNLSHCADDLLARFPQCGVSRGEILEALKQEASAAGLPTQQGRAARLQ